MAALTGHLALLATVTLFFSASNAASIQRRDLEAPLELDNGWEYEGCYVDSRRTINAATRSSPDMTNEMCADFCFDRGFAYFGTEYFEECFCGDKLASGGVKATEPECNTPCRGDPEQPCGGPDRLTLYKRPTGVPKENPGWNDYESIGCYVEGTTGRALSFELHSVPDTEMSVRKCIRGCAEHDYILAGVEFGGECFCGNTVVNGGKPAEDEDKCDMRCRGNSTELCGGSSHMNLYDFELRYTESLEEEEDKTTSMSSRASTTSTSSGTTSSVTSTTVSTTTSAASSEATTTTSSRSSDSSSTRSSTQSSATSETTTSSAAVSPASIRSSSQTSQSSTFVSSSARTSTSASSFASSSASLSTSTSASASSSASTSASSSASTSASSSVSSSASTSVQSSVSTSVTSSTPSTSAISTSVSSTPTLASSTPTQSSSATSVSTPSSQSTSQSSVVSTTTVSEAAEEPTECPYQPKSVGDWSYYGCYTEATGARALSSNAVASNDMTIAMCAEFCAGYTYFGVEYSLECFCGNTFNRGSVLTSASECNMICGGSECNYCGAGNRLSVYSIGDAPPPPSNTDDDGGLEEPSETTTGPQPTGLPDGWDYYGCWVDNINGRILTYQAPDDPTLTVQSCIDHCVGRGYSVAAPQFHTQCFCGNEIINGGEVADTDSECNTPCGGNSAQSCGGPNRMSVFSKGEPNVFGPPGPVETVGDWVYQGCAEDNVGPTRTFPWQLIFQDILTPQLCLDACAEFGYMAAGLEYGIECYCGDPANIDTAGADFVDEAECNIPCAGNGTAICGGGARMTTYFYEGDEPFYSWDFPEMGTPEAGRYEFLLGGVVIPLMTSQAVNGKVTFLEKWGTGPPNSTGAYELDLSLTDNFSAAWRTMHVKTDLFCAAGVTLPDKAGRQLTVGGWSGDSTYGVRLYTPDGSPGTPGVNDWEENVDILSLQDGRWYPSTLNMANGSILVIGGEEGSNGAPVPTLEILPYTGTAPLYMEWLERTDPNNLYPFLAVLPSQGIFVAYWNEARILDEETFETIQTLPNIPGAVNDPLGGRSYPLEGTAVLLPQKAPYTDPLGVLICGGSTMGIATALDNCVTIFPDAAEPEWVIERMPSKRVMSLMAPLPDGTYLILGGAKQGVAGFGLANTPNHNAVLYDPSKDVHSRMTIMANTTISRMYHSEALTLLDGRVLVSGSDPQDGVNPQEYRVEVFQPPYLLSGEPRPSFTIANTDWEFEGSYTFNLGSAPRNGGISATLLGSVSSTHGNSMGSRTLFPAVSCSGTSCTVTAPPGPYVCTPGWYQFFVLDGGIPAVGVFVRIGGDPAELGNWPEGEGFTTPSM